MSAKKSTLQNTTPLADRVYGYQLHVFQACFLLVCALPCLILIILLFPMLASFMASGPPRSSMLVLKTLVLLAPLVLLFVGLAYAAMLLAAVIHVFFIRIFVPALRMPEARDILLRFYSDPRWLTQSRGFKNFPWWISVWGGMGKNQRLVRTCGRLTAWTISLVYGKSAS
ncbi:MAG: hypothetical protein ACYDCJ_01635 [Gammaproteobacteria bacterium]